MGDPSFSRDRPASPTTSIDLAGSFSPRSLAQVISARRTCEDAGIDHGHCMSHLARDVDCKAISGGICDIGKEIAYSITDSLNGQLDRALAGRPGCKRLTLRSVPR